MDTTLALKGALLGFSVAAPVGPIGVLVIRRSLSHGRLNGFISGLGAATADALYGCIAGFGLTFITDALLSHQTSLQLLGGVFLCYLGLKTFLSKPADRPASADARGLWEAYVSTLLLTVTNPATILAFTAMFAGLGLASNEHSQSDAGQLVAGVFLGSALWWLTLSFGVSLLRGVAGPRLMQWVNRGSGVIIVAFGVLALVKLRG